MVSSDAFTPPMHVMAGVLRDAHGRVLLAQRPAGKHLAGMWEFPGGKLEPGELPFAALKRELHEELGIVVQRADPMIRVPCHYPQRSLLLDVWRCDLWEGEPQSMEGQALQWLAPARVDPAMLAPADRWILQALRLPTRYPVTPADTPASHIGRWFKRISQAIEQGERMLWLRLPLWPRERVRELAAALLPLATRHDANLLLDGDIEGARTLGVGVQLKASQLQSLSGRPLPWSQPVGASCRDQADLLRATQLTADFATLSPVIASRSHPQRSPLGWERFQAWAEAAALPVYALGGMTPANVEQARRCSGQGAAGGDEFWP